MFSIVFFLSFEPSTTQQRITPFVLPSQNHISLSMLNLIKLYSFHHLMKKPDSTATIPHLTLLRLLKRKAIYQKGGHIRNQFQIAWQRQQPPAKRRSIVSLCLLGQILGWTCSPIPCSTCSFFGKSSSYDIA